LCVGSISGASVCAAVTHNQHNPHHPRNQREDEWGVSLLVLLCNHYCPFFPALLLVRCVRPANGSIFSIPSPVSSTPLSFCSFFSLNKCVFIWVLDQGRYPWTRRIFPAMTLEAFLGLAMSNIFFFFLFIRCFVQPRSSVFAVHWIPWDFTPGGGGLYFAPETNK